MCHKKNPATEVPLTGMDVDFIDDKDLWPPVSFMSLDKAKFVDLVCDYLCSDTCDTGAFVKAVLQKCEAYKQYLIDKEMACSQPLCGVHGMQRQRALDGSDSKTGSDDTVADCKEIRPLRPPSPEPTTADEFDRASTAKALLASCNSEAQHALVVGIVTQLMIDNFGNVIPDDAVRDRFHEAVKNLPGGDPVFDSEADFYGFDNVQPVCTENTDEVETDEFPYGSVYETTLQQNAKTC